MTPTAGIVFDDDGLLLDTEPCWTRAQAGVFERHGRVFGLEGALELLDELRGGWPLAVASNAPRTHLLAGLTRVGLLKAFDVILGVEEVKAPKPGPDLYPRACELLAVAPTHSIALEDSPPGVAAARAAGLYVLGVPSVPGIVLEGDLVVESLEDPRVPITIGERIRRR